MHCRRRWRLPVAWRLLRDLHRQDAIYDWLVPFFIFFFIWSYPSMLIALLLAHWQASALFISWDVSFPFFYVYMPVPVLLYLEHPTLWARRWTVWEFLLRVIGATSSQGWKYVMPNLFVHRIGEILLSGCRVDRNRIISHGGGQDSHSIIIPLHLTSGILHLGRGF